MGERSNDHICKGMISSSYMQEFYRGLRSSAHKLRSATTDLGRSQAMAEIRTAVAGQRILIAATAHIDLTQIMQNATDTARYNLLFGGNATLASHQQMLVRCSRTLSLQSECVSTVCSWDFHVRLHTNVGVCPLSNDH